MAPSGVDAVAAVLRRTLDPRQVVDDRQQLRTYECDGLAHYKVVPGLVAFPHSAGSATGWTCGGRSRACR